MPLRALHPLQLLVVITACVALVLAAAPPVGAAHDDAAESLRLLERTRDDAERRSLQVCEELNRVAQAWSERMARQRRLHHNPAVGDQVRPWWKWSENVGVGASPRQVHGALVRSRGHRANLLDTRVEQVGVGVARGGGRVWVTQVFRDPRSGARCTRPA